MQDHLAQRDGWSALDWPGGLPNLGATALMTAGPNAAWQQETPRTTSHRGFTAYGGHAAGGRRLLQRLIIRRQAVRTRTTRARRLGLSLLDKAFPGEASDAAHRASSWLVTSRDDELDVDFPPLPDQ
jgi:hypothetical protein